MLPLLTSVSSILTAVLLFMMGNSLVGIALPLKLEAAGTAKAFTGIVMAAYFAGLMAGCVYGKTLDLPRRSHSGLRRSFGPQRRRGPRPCH